MKSRLLSARNLVLFMVLWLVIFGAYRAIQIPGERRLRLGYVRHVIALVDQHAKAHAGAWPRNWKDIEVTEAPADAPERTGSWGEVRDHVVVDFNVDPAALADSGADGFQAIRPKGSCGDYRADVEMLLATLRRLNGGNSPGGTSKKDQGMAAAKP